MPLGWIDFSKNERDKVLDVLDLLSEAGTLDELGIAPIRDGFADLFFSGISTIQTRAKYFLIVPYALKDLEHGDETNPEKALKSFHDVERQCGERFLEGTDTDGVIGSWTLSQNRWVKRTPADIYWSGLRNYGIFIGGNLSLAEYIRAMCAYKNRKNMPRKLGNRNDSADGQDSDDKDAGGIPYRKFWNIPEYPESWKDDLQISLTKDEGAFLKSQMIKSFPESMLAYILKNNQNEVLACKTFQEMQGMIQNFPKQIQDDYKLALAFSDFLYVLRTIYNRMISKYENKDAETEWVKLCENLPDYAAVDLEHIFDRLQVRRNVFLCEFLRRAQDLMGKGDLAGMEAEIRRRERELKQTRAKTLHSGEFDTTVWYGGKELDYRFGNARTIMRDIFISEGLQC